MTSLNLESRWLSLMDYLAQNEQVDADRFEGSVRPLGQAARRLAVTCWERFSTAGFRGALRLLCVLKAAGCTLETFSIPCRFDGLSIEVRGAGRTPSRLSLPAHVLKMRGEGLRAFVRKRLSAAGPHASSTGRSRAPTRVVNRP